MLGEEQTKMLNKLQFLEPKDKAYLLRAVPHPALKYILQTLLFVCFVNFENINSSFLHFIDSEEDSLNYFLSISFTCYKTVYSWYQKNPNLHSPDFLPTFYTFYTFSIYTVVCTVFDVYGWEIVYFSINMW